jgi:predicted GNAT family N-acyltransferase
LAESGFSIRIADWEREYSTLASLRREVFIIEQQVPEELEWDGLDKGALHLLAELENGEAVAAARLLPSGQIGRMAVRKPYRNHGVGTALLEYAVEEAHKAGFSSVFLHAQTQARTFYERHGFKVCGEEFYEADIPHLLMHKAIP